MLETLMHLIGICPDTHSHLDLLDVVAGGMLGSCGVFFSYFLHVLKRKVG